MTPDKLIVLGNGRQSDWVVFLKKKKEEEKARNEIGRRLT